MPLEILTTSEACRICFHNQFVDVDLFANYKTEYNIVEIIFELTSLQISNNDDLPKKLCEPCADKLVDFHLFRKQILDSQVKLVVEEDSSVSAPLTDDNSFVFVDVKNIFSEMFNGTDNGDVVHSNTKTTTVCVEKSLSFESNEKYIDTNVCVDKQLKKYNCDKCSKGFQRPSRFLAHYRSVHLKQLKRKTCPYCPRTFTMSSNSSSNLRRHIRNVHEGQEEAKHNYTRIKCVACDKLFWGSIEMYEHSKIHDLSSTETSNGFNLNCDECNINLETYEKLVSHMKAQHAIVDEKDVKPVRCRWCGERCKSLQGLYSHIRLVHKCENIAQTTVITSDMIPRTPIEKTSFLCTVCGKVLGSQTAYRNHMVIHSDVKPFRCDICPATFRHKISLTHHTFIHTQERNYCCTVCPKAFRQRAHLNSHLKTHGIGIKEKFPCNICSKEFLFRGALREHVWVHKEGFPHICNICGKGFLWKNRMEVHVRKEHSNTVNGR